MEEEADPLLLPSRFGVPRTSAQIAVIDWPDRTGRRPAADVRQPPAEESRPCRGGSADAEHRGWDESRVTRDRGPRSASRAGPVDTRTEPRVGGIAEVVRDVARPRARGIADVVRDVVDRGGRRRPNADGTTVASPVAGRLLPRPPAPGDVMAPVSGRMAGVLPRGPVPCRDSTPGASSLAGLLPLRTPAPVDAGGRAVDDALELEPAPAFPTPELILPTLPTGGVRSCAVGDAPVTDPEPAPRTCHDRRGGAVRGGECRLSQDRWRDGRRCTPLPLCRHLLPEEPTLPLPNAWLVVFCPRLQLPVRPDVPAGVPTLVPERRGTLEFDGSSCETVGIGSVRGNTRGPSFGITARDERLLTPDPFPAAGTAGSKASECRSTEPPTEAESTPAGTSAPRRSHSHFRSRSARPRPGRSSPVRPRRGRDS